jgi:hypothetical protein
VRVQQFDGVEHSGLQALVLFTSQLLQALVRALRSSLCGVESVLDLLAWLLHDVSLPTLRLVHLAICLLSRLLLLVHQLVAH